MAKVKVGSARSSYGNTSAGDQHGGQEVSTQDYYVHAKGWRVLVCTIAGAGILIAQAMQRACDNPDIGYSQGSRNTLYNDVKDRHFDPASTSKKVNTDCSALVRVCVQYAFDKLGIQKTVPDFITSGEASALLKTGHFKELTGDKYTKKADYLPKGAVLVTKTKGHTVVVLNSGDKCDWELDDEPAPVRHLGDRELSNGDSGEDVRELQSLLIQAGCDLGRWGADGDFGDATEIAVREFQRVHSLDVDGIVGPITLAALYADLEDDTQTTGVMVEIVGGNCYIRSEPSTSGKTLGVAHRGELFALLGVSADGWHQIRHGDVEGWVSGKYSTIR